MPTISDYAPTIEDIYALLVRITKALEPAIPSSATAVMQVAGNGALAIALLLTL